MELKNEITKFNLRENGEIGNYSAMFMTHRFG